MSSIKTVWPGVGEKVQMRRYSQRRKNGLILVLELHFGRSKQNSCVCSGEDWEDKDIADGNMEIPKGGMAYGWMNSYGM